MKSIQRTPSALFQCVLSLPLPSLSLSGHWPISMRTDHTEGEVETIFRLLIFPISKRKADRSQHFATA